MVRVNREEMRYFILFSNTHLLGLKGLIVSKDPTNADTPRAHITNMAALGMSNPVALLDGGVHVIHRESKLIKGRLSKGYWC